MAEPTRRDGGGLPLEAAERHDRICDRYERSWGAGAPIPIRDLLAEVPEDERPYLFTSLVRLEREFRDATPKELQDEYPEWGTLIDSVLPSHETPSDDNPYLQNYDPPALPGYEVVEMIGSGGMGVVFRGRILALDVPVAIKMVKSGGWHRPEDLSRFEREIRAVAKFNHPNIVRVYHCGEHDKLPFFSMELVDGGPLSKWLGGKPADPLAAAELVETLARTMQYVHERGIVHRDLKPGNVLLATVPGPGPTPVPGPRSAGPSNAETAEHAVPGRPAPTPPPAQERPPLGQFVPKIADFGLAKRMTDGDRLTRTSAVIGTASYMSPEQAAGRAREVGPGADVYSLGAILFELLTGRPPFVAENYEMTVFQVIAEEPPRPSVLAPGVPSDLEAVCLKCLEKEPADRYQSARDLADDLKRFREGLPVNARPMHVIDQDKRWAKKIGYEIVELLGAGRWVFAYIARQMNINRTVLLKVSTGKVGSKQHAAIRRQGEALAGLSHPNLLGMHDYGEQHGTPYMIMEFVEGGATIADRLRNPAGLAAKAGEAEADRPDPPPAPAPFPPRYAAEVARGIALGLQALHDHGVLHCGVHSNDIVLTRTGQPKVGGFGACRRFGTPPDDPGVPAPEWVRMNYHPPEVLAGKWDLLGPASDVYALGAVLYDMLVGLPPFQASSLEETRELVLSRKPDPPSRHVAVPPELETVCLKCLEKDPAKRYPTCDDLAEELKTVIARWDEARKTEDLSTVMLGGGSLRDPVMTFQLRVVNGPGQLGHTFPLPRHRVMVGRSAECDLPLPSPVVSRVHCGVVWNPDTGKHEVLDYGARNGTYVNGERVKGSRPLAPGDRIQITDFVIVFEPRAPELPPGE